MTVTAVHKDPSALTMSLTSELDGPPRAVWRLIAEPRLLERWWGPPEWPATFGDFSLSPGEEIRYFMTEPDGTKAHAWWTVLSVDPPHTLVVTDGFGDQDGEPSTDLPAMTVRFEVTALDGGRSRMVVTSTFPSTEAMEQVLAMGMEEGLTAAAGQLDDLVAELASTA